MAPGLTTQRTDEYELVLVLSPEASDDETVATLDRLAGFISERGGDAPEWERWGVRRLAYPISDFMEGNYVLTRFSLSAAETSELERALNSSTDVLRHLLTKAARPKN